MRSIPLHSTDSITKEPPAQPSANDLPVAKANYASSGAARSRGKKFLSYYKPYIGLFFADMACALIVSAITLLLPLCARYITKNILESNTPHALNHIYLMGALMLALVGVQTLCTMFIDFQGHMMGAKMESDMRRELFEQYQKLSFRFYDEQRTGQLMTRITNDTFALAELYHHGPEDIVITCLTVAGAFIILLKVNVALTLIVFLFLPMMAVYALYFNKKMNRALRSSKDRIGDINAQVEDTLAGIRVVKSFTNEDVEKGKFAYANNRFVASRRDGYKSEAYFSGGLIAFTQLITIAVIIFKYKEDHNYVVKNLSLEIQAGEYIALVGSSGVGKTTLCSLIPRFYEVNAGKILLDGQDIRDVTLRSLRRNIGIVQQDVYLFAGSVADNIRYGKLDASQQEIIDAAKQAHAHDFIMALPDGYDTDIGQRGVRLSGGQKQRLSIARVFIKNPPVIIFDEATSALDNESEKAVQDSLEKLADNRTTLVIAHRLSTIRNAQRIVVLSDTGIGEQGTHAELLALNGVYANLYNMQSKI